MPRKKFEFIEEMNFRIAQLVEAGKSYDEILESIKRDFNVEVSRSTIVKQVKHLGLEIRDNRSNYGFKKREIGENELLHIKMMREMGSSAKEIAEDLKKTFGSEVGEKKVMSIIKENNFEVLFNPDFKYDMDFGDEEDACESNDVEKDENPLSKYEKEQIEKITSTENFKRYTKFIMGAKLDEDDFGYKLWWTRDGFLAINNFSISIEDDLRGEYNNQRQFDSWLKVFTTIDKNEVGDAKKIREELNAWYALHKDRINALYDDLTIQGVHLDKLDEFNSICEEGWGLFMKYHCEKLPSDKSKSMLKGAISIGQHEAFVDAMKKMGVKI